VSGRDPCEIDAIVALMADQMRRNLDRMTAGVLRQHYVSERSYVTPEDIDRYMGRSYPEVNSKYHGRECPCGIQSADCEYHR
jgi:hypothetical protein